jgi:hypothetical protein
MRYVGVAPRLPEGPRLGDLLAGVGAGSRRHRLRFGSARQDAFANAFRGRRRTRDRAAPGAIGFEAGHQNNRPPLDYESQGPFHT